MAVFESLSSWPVFLALTVIVITILYQTSAVFKCHFKLITYYTLSLGIGLAVTVYALFRPKSPSNHFFITRCVNLFLKQAVGMDVTVRGKSNLDKAETAILVLNHQSSLDMIPMFIMWPENCVSIAKRELLYLSGTFGIGAWLCGTIFIDRLNPERARKTMEKTAENIKKKKLRVVIFPEGTRNHGGSLLPFKKGGFHLAVQAQVPIIPVVFSSYNNFYDKKERRFDEGKVIAEILEPIPTEGLTSADVTELSERTRQTMLETFDKISQEVRS
ncbi:1-acyl-sn-glycerol-3-phosphate acyltransferase [Elysia marginata]|uniref:1-acyl-sn-glycerol-3-phosphate acyltransferase n=1 Tax=Elysia marginata TaxID=1093978 RepID=A0AAV4EFZ6_9GAST|nr:1-acyl-sn-glycerol-3-phosphate acyltransferase [Elysia marginata]